MFNFIEWKCHSSKNTFLQSPGEVGFTWINNSSIKWTLSWWILCQVRPVEQDSVWIVWLFGKLRVSLRLVEDNTDWESCVRNLLEKLLSIINKYGMNELDCFIHCRVNKIALWINIATDDSTQWCSNAMCQIVRQCVLWCVISFRMHVAC